MASASNVIKATIRQLNNKDVRLRRRAVRKLFELDDPAAIDAFIPLLKENDEWFREKALMAIQRWASMKDLDLAEKLSKSKKPEERILAHVSNFRPDKRTQDVIKIFAKVNKEIPSKLLMVGDGPERFKAEQLSKDLGVANNVIFFRKI